MLKHLICNLRIESHCAVLELVEWRIESLVDADELLFEPLELALVLQLRFLQSSDLVGELVKILLPSLHILLAFHQEYLLLLVMLLDCFGEGVLSVFEHFDHELQLLI